MFFRRDGPRSFLRIAAILTLWVGVSFGAEVIPPPPPNHFNDFAGVVRRETAGRLNSELAQFERDTSNQIVVAIYPRMQSDSSVEDYTVRVAQRWGVGQRDKRNGAVLFLFQESHDVRIVTGYGLEAVLPDALCKRIIETELIPRFRAGDFDGGLTAGVGAMMAAVRGEYRGTGRLVADRGSGSGGFSPFALLPVILFVLFFVGILRRRSRRNVFYGPRGRRSTWSDSGPWWGGPWGGGGNWGGGGWGGGGGSSGGGTFSGGGGSFGGGGAGGKW